jgi:DNA primase
MPRKRRSPKTAPTPERRIRMLRASPVYQEHPKRRGVSRRRVIDEAKAKVPVIDLADLLCGPAEKMRRVGEEWMACCPLNDHEDKTPSFAVNPEKNVWFCHGCLRGGDVVELARFAWDLEKAEVADAAAYLLMEFGHDVPQRPRRWFARQERQKPVREALEEVKVRHVQRRLYRLFAPDIERIEDQTERKAEKAQTWHDLRQVAVLVVAGRRSA